MSTFIMVCSYVSMFSLSMLLFCIFLFRYYRIRGKDNRGVGLLMMLFTVLFILGVILIGVFYR